MSLAPGTTLGQYTIVSAIGAGGMGEVYRATDTRLGRDVAIKVLPDDVAANPDRLARFEREARALAALNHFNIAQVYGFEGTALIMELLEGETLRERIERGPLPIRKAIEYATQIARGLAAAHDRGIIHRDLKPENVFVVTDGHVKILDFGLARHEAQLEGVTRTAHHSTTPGTVLGTVGYMSPEQVRGAAVDARSDLFSLGAVLYEMLTGTRAFRRESSAETMAAIVNDHPREVTVLRADVTPSLDRIVQHCLEKSPLERFQSARDVAFALDSLSGSAPAIPGDAPASSGAPWERIIWAALAASLAVALVWALMPAAQPEPPPQAPVTRTLLPLPNEVLINEIAGQGSRIALSPDGSRLVFHGRFVASGQSVLFVLPLDGSPGTPLAGTEAGAAPFWSPDGRQIMFTTLNTLVRLPLDGGNPVPVATGVASGFTPGTWNQDGVVLIGGQALHQVTVATGAVSELLKHDNEIYGFPQFLPDGRRFIDSVRTATGVVEVHTGRLGSADTRVLLSTPDQGKALYAAGALLYTRGTTLFGQRVEGDPLTLAGEAVSIAAQLESTPTRGATFTVSDNGVLVYQTAARQAARLTWMDRTGTPQSMIGDEADYNNVELSANNLRALVSITDLRFQSRDIFLVDLERGVRQRFTNDPSDERSAIWSQDNRRVLYSSKGLDLYLRAADSSGEEQRAIVDGIAKDPYDWSRDGKWILYRRSSRTTGNDVYLAPAGGTDAGRALVATPFSDVPGTFSPDGRFVVYQSDESGQPEVYVTNVTGGGKTQVSNHGGVFPIWRGDGREILYLSTDRMLMSAVVTPGAELKVSAPVPLFKMNISMTAGRMYDVTPDGKRFLAAIPVPTRIPPSLVVVTNWPRLLDKQQP